MSFLHLSLFSISSSLIVLFFTRSSRWWVTVHTDMIVRCPHSFPGICFRLFFARPFCTWSILQVRTFPARCLFPFFLFCSLLLSSIFVAFFFHVREDRLLVFLISFLPFLSFSSVAIASRLCSVYSVPPHFPCLFPALSFVRVVFSFLLLCVCPSYDHG